MATVTNRIIRNVAELREFCDAVETTLQVDPTKVMFTPPLDMWVDKYVTPVGTVSFDVYWTNADPDEVAEMEEAESCNPTTP